MDSEYSHDFHVNFFLSFINLFLYFFFLFLYAARTLKEVSNLTSGDATTAHNKEGHDGKFKPEEHEFNAGSEVFSMDYTPASRKPPIHN